MPNIIILRGPYCSGKTTWASKYCKKHKNSIRLAPMEIARSLASGGSVTELIPISQEMVNSCILNAIILNKNIIIDGENFLDSQVKNLLELIEDICKKNRQKLIDKNIHYNISIKVFNSTPLEICLDRNNKMQNPKKESLITKGYNYFHKIGKPF